MTIRPRSPYLLRLSTLRQRAQRRYRLRSNSHVGAQSPLRSPRSNRIRPVQAPDSRATPPQPRFLTPIQPIRLFRTPATPSPANPPAVVRSNVLFPPFPEGVRFHLRIVEEIDLTGVVTSDEEESVNEYEDEPDDYQNFSSAAINNVPSAQVISSGEPYVLVPRPN